MTSSSCACQARRLRVASSVAERGRAGGGDVARADRHGTGYLHAICAVNALGRAPRDAQSLSCRALRRPRSGGHAGVFVRMWVPDSSRQIAYLANWGSDRLSARDFTDS